MSTTSEEKDYIIESAVDGMYSEIVLKGYMTADELIERLAELVHARG